MVVWPEEKIQYICTGFFILSNGCKEPWIGDDGLVLKFSTPEEVYAHIHKANPLDETTIPIPVNETISLQ